MKFLSLVKGVEIDFLEIGQKIHEARKNAGLTQVQLAQKIGVTDRSVKRYEKTGENITLEILYKIAEYCNIDISYFLSPNLASNCQLDVSQSSKTCLPIVSQSQTNVPSVSLDKQKPVTKSSLSDLLNNISEEAKNLPSNQVVQVSYYPNVLASAGYGATNTSDEAQIIDISVGFLRTLGVRSFKKLDLIAVVGDSMEPFVSNGELIIVEKESQTKNNDIVIASLSGEIYVKRFIKDPLNRYVKLISSNSIYGEIELRGEEIEALTIIGVVRAKIRPF